MWLMIPPWGTDYCSACDTLAGQTWVTSDNNTFTTAYGGGDLVFNIRLDNMNIYEDLSYISELVCDFDGISPAADMAVLPQNHFVMTDPAGNCAVVVSVESFP